MVVVNADFNGGGPEQVGASLQIGFGMALWVALFLHGVGVESYLNLKPKERERLRMVSCERQLEAGFENPGSAGWPLRDGEIRRNGFRIGRGLWRARLN